MPMKVAYGLLTILFIPCISTGCDAQKSTDTVSTAPPGNRSYLKEQITNARSDMERFYWTQCDAQEQAKASNDLPQLQNIADALAEFGKKNASSDPYGARSFCLAADIEMEKFQRYGKAREYLGKVSEAYTKHPEWDGYENYTVYPRLRVGESFYAEGNYDGALTEWIAAFRQFPDFDFSLQLPTKVVDAYSKALPKEQALTKAFPSWMKQFA